jgi:serine/threonine protein kinase
VDAERSNFIPMEDNSDTFGLVGRTLAEKYKVERVVAKGGFGTVYCARHIALDVPVAIKVLRVPDRFEGELRAEFLDGFKLEARTIASLAHPAIVRVIDYGSASFASGESPWMALDWIEGRTLEADLEGRPVGAGRSPHEVLDLLRPAFDALACAHAAGIAHRDIKPANMILARARRGEPGLRVLDFGVAKVMEVGEQAGSGHTATRTELSSYSLYYAAPEQLSHARTGPWTDVHALALLLVELLTGQRAYRATDAVAIYSDILDRERPTPGRAGVDVGPWEPVLARALALRPSDRHADADALLAALEASLDPAEAAWRSSRASTALAPATQPSADTVRPRVRGLTPDSLAGASGVKPPPPRRHRWLVPAVAALGLSLVAVGVRAVTRPDARSPVAGGTTVLPVRSTSARATPELTSVVAAPRAEVVAPAAPPAPASHVDGDRSPEPRVRRGRPRREPSTAAPRATAAIPAPPAPAAATVPSIVIE